MRARRPWRRIEPHEDDSNPLYAAVHRDASDRWRIAPNMIEPGGGYNLFYLDAGRGTPNRRFPSLREAMRAAEAGRIP